MGQESKFSVILCHHIHCFSDARCDISISFIADGFVVQTGDPDGPAEGFVDPSTGKTRTLPLEIMAKGEKAPFYGETLEVSLLFTEPL